PPHMTEKGPSCFNHVLARGIILGRPVEAHMLDGIFRRPAAGADAGLLLQQFGVARGPDHFVDGGWDMVVRAIDRVRPRDALVGLLGLGIVGKVIGKSAEGLGVRHDFNDHRGTRATIWRISLSRGSRSAGSGSPVWWRCRTIWFKLLPRRTSCP